MSGFKYLLDTNFIIALHNREPKALDLIHHRQITLTACAISVVNYIEVLGFEQLPEDEASFRRLLGCFVRYPLSENITTKTIELRKRHKIKFADCVILATALCHDLELITFDEALKHKHELECSHQSKN